ncbi:MAG: hypothetical protein H8K10_20450 [Nitrospira sp.]|nr:hypothetical protein [Nitrospira sp.]
MRIHQIIITRGLRLFLATAGLVPVSLTVYAAEQKPIVAVAPVKAAAVASGAVEDTLPTCLARIPQGATPGQRLIAEQGCQRDEFDRASMRAVPGR